MIPVLNRGHLRKIPYDFCLAGLIFSLPLITIGAANAFGWMLAYLRGAIVIADWITSIAGNNPQYMMLLLVLLFTIVGDFIEPVPTIIIFMPLVNTLTQAGDINGVHMGVVLIATLAFGMITPPYGLVLLMASKFVGVPFSKALRAALPIYVVFLVTIIFTIYCPKVVLWLPKHVIPEFSRLLQVARGHRLYLSELKPALTVRSTKCVSNREATVGLHPSRRARRALLRMKTSNSACGLTFPCG